MLCILNNKLILNLLEERLKENTLLFLYLMIKTRKLICSLFLNRETEGHFKILINSHLFENGITFREFFVLVENNSIFYYHYLKWKYYKMFTRFSSSFILFSFSFHHRMSIYCVCDFIRRPISLIFFFLYFYFG